MHEFLGHMHHAFKMNEGYALKNVSEENLENAHKVYQLQIWTEEFLDAIGTLDLGYEHQTPPSYWKKKVAFKWICRQF